MGSLRVRFGLLAAALVALAVGLVLLRSESDREVDTAIDVEAPARASEPDAASAGPKAASGPATPEPAPGSRRVARGGEESARAEPAKDDLVVEVVDSRGRPVADLPLALGARPPWRTFAELRAAKVPAARTDAEGLAVFPNARAVLRRGRKTPVHVYHLVAFHPLPSLELTPRVLNEARVRSVQPDWGTLEVQVVELDGSPAGDLEEIRLHLEDEREDSDPTLGRTRPKFRTTPEGSVGRFPFVDPGGTWLGSARREGAHEASWSSEAVTPAVGGTRALRIRFGADLVVARFRLLDDAASPLSGGRVAIELQTGTTVLQEFERSVDADGFVRVETPWRRGSRNRPLVRFTRGEGDGTTLVGRAQVDQARSPGLHDCGDVRLEPERLLVRGVVLDEAGRPVPGATVGFGARAHFEASSPVFGDMDRLERTLRTTDEAGRFSFVGAIPAEPRVLWAFIARLARGQPGAPALPARSDVIAYTGPGQDVSLTVKARLRPSVRFHVPEGWLGMDAHINLIDRLRVEVDPVDADLPALVLSRRGQKGYGGTFTFEPTEGRRFDVRYWLGDRLLGEARDLQQEGDAPLLDVDLSTRLHRRRITLAVATDESPDRSGILHLRPAGDEASPWTRTTYDSLPIEVVTPDARVDVRILPERHAEVWLNDLAGDVEVELKAPYRIRLALVSDGPLPESPYSLQPYFTIERHGLGAAEGSAAYTAQSGERTFLLPVHGPVRVSWFLHKTENETQHTQPVFYREEFTIDVTDQPGEQRVELEIDGALLRKLWNDPPF